MNDSEFLRFQQMVQVKFDQTMKVDADDLHGLMLKALKETAMKGTREGFIKDHGERGIAVLRGMYEILTFITMGHDSGMIDHQDQSGMEMALVGVAGYFYGILPAYTPLIREGDLREEFKDMMMAKIVRGEI